MAFKQMTFGESLDNGVNIEVNGDIVSKKSFQLQDENGTTLAKLSTRGISTENLDSPIAADALTSEYRVLELGELNGKRGLVKLMGNSPNRSVILGPIDGTSSSSSGSGLQIYGNRLRLTADSISENGHLWGNMFSVNVTTSNNGGFLAKAPQMAVLNLGSSFTTYDGFNCATYGLIDLLGPDGSTAQIVNYGNQTINITKRITMGYPFTTLDETDSSWDNVKQYDLYLHNGKAFSMNYTGNRLYIDNLDKKELVILE